MQILAGSGPHADPGWIWTLAPSWTRVLPVCCEEHTSTSAGGIYYNHRMGHAFRSEWPFIIIIIIRSTTPRHVRAHRHTPVFLPFFLLRLVMCVHSLLWLSLVCSFSDVA